MTAHLKVTAAGPLVTVQDAGRFGMARFGVTASGPMDRLAYRAANAALGNPPNAPAIEVSLGGLRLECLSGPISLAITGGGFIVETVERFGSWQVLTLQAGDRLTIRRGPWGSWCYLAFAGTFAPQTWLGSAATHGGFGKGGGKLSSGAELLIQAPRILQNRPLPCPNFARPRHQLRVTIGPQNRFFAPETLVDFQTKPFALTPAYDRMGVRLSGPDLTPNVALTMPSEPIARGSIQVAGDGVATLLLADHQTTGGYPKIATVLDCDLDAATQLRGHDRIGFTAASPHQAIQIARLHARMQVTFLTALRPR